MCWDDSVLAIGTEVGSIELYSVKKILTRAEQALRDQKTSMETLGQPSSQTNGGPA